MLHFTTVEKSVVEVERFDGFLVVVVFVGGMLGICSICRERLWNDLMRRAKRILYDCISNSNFVYTNAASAGFLLAVSTTSSPKS